MKHYFIQDVRYTLRYAVNTFNELTSSKIQTGKLINNKYENYFLSNIIVGRIYNKANIVTNTTILCLCLVEHKE